LIYSHKPQRSGRNISANTNFPPQDPPAPRLQVVAMQKLESTIQLQKVEIEKLLGYQKSYELLKSENSVLELQYKSQQSKLEKITQQYSTFKEKSAIIQSKLKSEIKDKQTLLDLQQTKVKQLTEEIASLQVPDVLIEDSTPPVLDLVPDLVTAPEKKVSWFRRFIRIFRRK